MPWGWFTQALCVRGRSDGVCKASSGGASPLIPRRAVLPRLARSPLTPDVQLVVYKFMTGARFRTIADDVRERIALGDLGDVRRPRERGGARTAVRREPGHRPPGAGAAARAGPGREPAGLGLVRHRRVVLADPGARDVPARVLGGRRGGPAALPAGGVLRLRAAAGRRAREPAAGRRRGGPAQPLGPRRRRRAARPRPRVGPGRPGRPAQPRRRRRRRASGRACSGRGTGSPRSASGSPPASPPTRTPPCSGWAPAPRCCWCAGSRSPATAARSPCPTTATWPTGSASRSSSTAGRPRDEPPGLRTVAGPD